MRKKIALLLGLIFLLSAMPTMAFAANEVAADVIALSISDNGGSLTAIETNKIAGIAKSDIVYAKKATDEPDEIYAICTAGGKATGGLLMQVKEGVFLEVTKTSVTVSESKNALQSKMASAGIKEEVITDILFRMEQDRLAGNFNAKYEIYAPKAETKSQSSSTSYYTGYNNEEYQDT